MRVLSQAAGCQTRRPNPGTRRRSSQRGGPLRRRYPAWLRETFNLQLARSEVLSAWLFNAGREVHNAADDWLTDYNKFRPHESLGNVPPAVFLPRKFDAKVSTAGLSS
jgi:transposase InsO family protein